MAGIKFKVVICILKLRLKQQLSWTMDQECCLIFLHYYQCNHVTPSGNVDHCIALSLMFLLFDHNIPSLEAIHWNCAMNARWNRSADFLCYIESCSADILAITETWFTEIDSARRVEVTPPRYKLYDHARSGLTGEWDCLTLCHDNLGVTKVAVG